MIALECTRLSPLLAATVRRLRTRLGGQACDPDLGVAGVSINEGMTIQRTTTKGDVSLYVVQAKCDGVWYTDTVRHREADGPWELIHKALKTIRKARK